MCLHYSPQNAKITTTANKANLKASISRSKQTLIFFNITRIIINNTTNTTAKTRLSISLISTTQTCNTAYWLRYTVARN